MVISLLLKCFCIMVHLYVVLTNIGFRGQRNLEIRFSFRSIKAKVCHLTLQLGAVQNITLDLFEDFLKCMCLKQLVLRLILVIEMFYFMGRAIDMLLSIQELDSLKVGIKGHYLLPCIELNLQMVMVLILISHGIQMSSSMKTDFVMCRIPPQMGLARECYRISQMTDSTKQAFSRLHGDDAFLYMSCW